MMLESRKKLEEAFRLLNEGKTSFRDLESKLGVPKSTLHRWYVKWLKSRIEERRRALADLEQKISRLQMEFNTLKNEYEEKSRVLEEEHSKRRKSLEGEIERLKRDYETIKASFERQGISWDEGLAIVANVVPLKNEREILRGEVERLKLQAYSSALTALRTMKRNFAELSPDCGLSTIYGLTGSKTSYQSLRRLKANSTVH